MGLSPAYSSMCGSNFEGCLPNEQATRWMGARSPDRGLGDLLFVAIIIIPGPGPHACMPSQRKKKKMRDDAARSTNSEMFAGAARTMYLEDYQQFHTYLGENNDPIKLRHKM